MRALLQRVGFAKVEFISPDQSQPVSREIGKGLLALVGFSKFDSQIELAWMARKIVQLRIFPDAEGKLNLSLEQTQGDLMVVSQFTLYADTQKGNRPSFESSAPPAIAFPLYEQFLQTLKATFPGRLQTGDFGADMKVTLQNDGPVTILLEKERP